MKNLIRIVVIMALLPIAGMSFAGKGGKPPPLSPINLMNIVTVSEENGDYRAPSDAVDDITNEGINNPYLIVIGPGVYNINRTIEMRPYISIKGSGQETTILEGYISGGPDESSAIVKGADNAALTDMTIINHGGIGYSYAIYNILASPLIERVVAIAEGAYGYANTAILNDTSSSPIIRNVTAIARGGSPTESFGIYNVREAMPTLSNVTVEASGGGWRSPGVLIDENSSPFIVNSVINAEPGLVLGLDASGSVVNNKIVGGVVASSTYTGASICRGNYDENLDDVHCDTSP